MMLRRRLELLVHNAGYRNTSTTAILHNKWARPTDFKPPLEKEVSRKKNNTDSSRRQFKQPHMSNTRKDSTPKTSESIPPSLPNIEDTATGSRTREKFNNKKKSGRSSLLSSIDDGNTTAWKNKDKRSNQIPSKNKDKEKEKNKGKRAGKPAKRQVFVPAFISVANLSRLFNLRLGG